MMIAATASTASTNQPQPRRLSRLKQILLTAFLSFGVAVPFASANCLGKGLIQPQSFVALHAMPAAAERQALAASPDAKVSVSIVGLWNLTFLYQGQVVDVAFDAWHQDGTEVLNDYTNPIEGNVCLGVWQQTGPRSYTLKHPSWYFDTNGNLLGTVVIHETITLSPDGNSFTGSYTDDVYDVSGNLLEALSGQLEASRIKAE